MKDDTENQSTGEAIDAAELDKIASQAEQAEQAEQTELTGELMEQQDGPSTAEVLQPVIDLVCAIAAPNWEIKAGERQAMAESYGELVDKYFPDGMGAWGVELNALLVTTAIIGPRVASGKPRVKEEPRQPQAGDLKQSEGAADAD